MKRKYIFAVTLMISVFAASFLIWMPHATAQQQADTIAISPTSGPPGTVVTLSIIAGNGWGACFAGDAQLGAVTSSTTYTIPQNVEVGRQIKFYCSNTSVATARIFSNIVWFTITEPPPTDSDGDGVPDQSDQCPNEYGPASNSGCPIPVTVPPPSDLDGDGVPDQSDQCPNEYGPANNAGCPVPFTVPTDGSCVIATFGQVVNVRSGPSLQDTIVGSLYAETLYYPIGRTERTDGTWWQITNGWVSGAAVQWGGACAALPDTGPVVVTDADGDGIADAQDQCPLEFGPASNGGCPLPVDTDGDGVLDPQDMCLYEAGPASNNGCPEASVAVVPSVVDLNAALAECPQWLADAQALPIHLQLNIVYGVRMESSCDYLNSLLTDLVFGQTGPALSDENAQAIMDQCPDVLPALVGMMDRLRDINPRAWQILDSVMTPENACQLARDLASGKIPPDFGSALGGTASTTTPAPTKMLMNLRAGPLYALASDDLIDTAIALCITDPISLDRAIAIRERIKSAGIEDTELFATPCPIVNFFADMGDLSSAQQIFVDVLTGECGLDKPDAYFVAQLAQVLGVDWTAVLALDGPTLCADIGGAIFGSLKDPTTDPNVAASMLTCPNLAYHLQDYEAELSLYEMWIILSAPDPCVPAAKFIDLGVLDFVDQTYPLPACFDIAANTVTLADSSVLTGESPWAHKIAVLSRAPGDICGGIVLDVADSDGDGVLDDTDLCPEEFALTVNGCPDGIAPNAAPVINPIPDQVLMQGASIDIGVVATDADGDPLTLNAVPGNPAIASAILAGNILTVTGGTAGITPLTISATDGTDTTDMVFNVTVNAPAPNTPPIINPIADQIIPGGVSLNIAITASDADGDPLTFSAVSANPAVAVVSVAGPTLTLTGINTGTTPITVIVADGSASSSIMFNIEVQFPAPPLATPRPVGPGPAPVPGSSTGVGPALVDQAAATGLAPDLEEYGLLDLPGEFVIAPSAVFQSSEGIDQPINIFIIAGGQLSQPLSPSTDSNVFPALDPAGELLAFMTVDVVGNVTLRVLNLSNNASLPILSATATFTVGQYPVAWSPEGDNLLVTLLDAAGVPSIYIVPVNDPTNPEPVLLVVNATTASYSPNGDFIAFEKIDSLGASSIYVLAVTNPGAAHQITDLPAGSSCFSPMFGADSVALFFACDMNGEQILYRYGIQGLTALNVGVPGAVNPVPGPGEGFMGFDDGAVIYYGYDDGSRVVPMLRLQGQNANHIRWTTLADLE